MMLFRSAKESDLDAIYQLAQESGIGITTLPKDKKLLKQRLDRACASFQTKSNSPQNEYYFFVLEDSESKQVIGTSAIEAQTGYDSPFYSYKISKRTRISYALNIRSDYEVLSLVNDYQGYSELCTLFLHPQYRKDHNGLLLSKARFLFIVEHPNRFAKTLIAELRGISNEQGESPFWSNVGLHFFHLSFEEADRLTLASNKQFIADLMPRHPIYIKLLSPKAQKAIGKAHRSSLAAMKILLKEGFRYNHYVDIFDAGPTIEAPIDEIKTIQLSRVLQIINLSDEVSSPQYLIATASIEFRATLGPLLLNPKENTCIIAKSTAVLLKVGIGDSLRVAPLFFDL